MLSGQCIFPDILGAVCKILALMDTRVYQFGGAEPVGFPRAPIPWHRRSSSDEPLPSSLRVLDLQTDVSNLVASCSAA